MHRKQWKIKSTVKNFLEQKDKNFAFALVLKVK